MIEKSISHHSIGHIQINTYRTLTIHSPGNTTHKRAICTLSTIKKALLTVSDFTAFPNASPFYSRSGFRFVERKKWYNKRIAVEKRNNHRTKCHRAKEIPCPECAHPTKSAVPNLDAVPFLFSSHPDEAINFQLGIVLIAVLAARCFMLLRCPQSSPGVFDNWFYVLLLCALLCASIASSINNAEAHTRVQPRHGDLAVARDRTTRACVFGLAGGND